VTLHHQVRYMDTLQSVTQLDTGTVTSSGRGGTAVEMAQNQQTAEEHSTN